MQSVHICKSALSVWDNKWEVLLEEPLEMFHHQQQSKGSKDKHEIQPFPSNFKSALQTIWGPMQAAE
eukprot:1146333-Pelagomonas_calceolata.AAC.9